MRVPVSQEEMELAYQVPAPGANKFVVTLGQPGLRIAFGEHAEQLRSPHFHTAITLHPLDAIVLYKILAEMLAPLEREFRASGAIRDESQDG